MIRAGDSVVNPVTGERLDFHRTSQETDGEYCSFDVYVEAGGAVAAAHVHPFQTETFTVVSGTLGVKAGREKKEYAAGETVVIEPGTPHKFWNAGTDTLRFRAEVRPALQFESLIETMFGLATDGKTNRKGMPNPLRLAVIAKHHFDVVRLPGIPAWMQKAALATGAPIGRLVGYQATYQPAPSLAGEAELAPEPAPELALELVPA
jgi:quercetin dioxygenase-like cupin family protein